MTPERDWFHPAVDRLLVCAAGWPMLCITVLLITGCPPDSPVRERGPILPIRQAARIVDDNIAKIEGSVRASGPISGYATEDGSQRGYDVDGVLFFAPPASMRLVFKSIGGTQLAAGTDGQHFWINNKVEGDYYLCRPVDRIEPELAEQLPVLPHQMVGALGLSPIEPFAQSPMSAPRNTDSHQQIMYLDITQVGAAGDLPGPARLQEIWLSRDEPRLVDQVIYRNALGDIEMRAVLSDYQVKFDGRVMLPMRIAVTWPLAGAGLEMRIKRWQQAPDIGPDAPQYVPPHTLGLRFETEDIVE